jgi:predicted nucleotide-binding protein
MSVENIDLPQPHGAQPWIAAPVATQLLTGALGRRAARYAIAARAHDGMVQSRADRFVRGNRVLDDAELPREFWWARGYPALTQNWVTGDFETWIDHHELWKAYGVRFLRSDIEKMIPEGYVETIQQPNAKWSSSRKVFVVHGHDTAALQGVARFLEQLGLEATILSEQPDAGRTIIEKFVDCADEVGFAVVLLTPDDLGGSAGALTQATRARQNVIFELGYFAGKLGRGRTCLLCKGSVEIPSDLYGVIYTELDSAEGWKRKLARELQAAGFEFDPAQVLA